MFTLTAISEICAYGDVTVFRESRASAIRPSKSVTHCDTDFNVPAGARRVATELSTASRLTCADVDNRLTA